MDCTIKMMQTLFVFVAVLFLLKYLLGDVLSEHMSMTHYPHNFGSNPDPGDLGKILTSKCDVNYCGAHTWNNVELPEGYDVANISTQQGCCVVPLDIKKKMYESRGLNNTHY